MMTDKFNGLRAVCFATVLALTAPLATSQGLELLDRVAAVVDDDIVMESELNARIQQIVNNMQTQGAPLPPQDELRTQVLNQMIVENLQLQMGERAGVRINDQQLNSAMGNIARNMNMSLDQFRAQLEAEGSYLTTRDQIRREMVLRQVQNGNLGGRIQISDQEIENFLESSDGQELTAPRFNAAHLMFPLAEGETTTEANAAAEQLLSQAAQDISGGISLVLWLQQYNDVNEPQLQGGELGWRQADELPSIFSELVPSMLVGEVAGPIQSPGGLHLVQLINKSGGPQMIEQTHARHILVKPSEIRTEEQCLALLSDLRQQIIDGADFAELARDNTEDIASAQEGGDLGWASPGQFVPAFEEAMKATEPGQITQPIRSNFGWHIIEVIDRREYDITPDRLRERAYGQLYDRKFSEELDSWLQKIRDEAYVDIKV
jgi:peptidyl-prolyl cis-trans isomerase SurA